MSAPLPASPFRTTQERKQEHEIKRQAMLLAAVRMFNQRGFHAASLDDVAASLGVSKPLIYHYLGTKDQVLFECVRIGLQELLEVAAGAPQGAGNGLDRLRHFLHRYGEIIMGDFGRCVIRTGEEALSPASRAEFRRLKRGIDDALRGMIAAAAADGSILARDVKLIAFTIAGALNWTARWQEPGLGMSPETIARDMVELLITGLLPASPRGQPK